MADLVRPSLAERGVHVTRENLTANAWSEPVPAETPPTERLFTAEGIVGRGPTVLLLSSLGVAGSMVVALLVVVHFGGPMEAVALTAGTALAAVGCALGAAVIDARQRSGAARELRRWARIFRHVEWGVCASAARSRSLDLMNPAFATMHGYELRELTGRGLEGVIIPEERARYDERVARADAEGHHVWESIHLRKNGTLFPVLVDLISIRSEDDGRVLYRVTSIQDITDRRRAEDEARRSKDAAEAAARAKSQFLANMSHELRTPLNSILGFAEILQDHTHGPLNAAQERFVGNVVESGRDLLSLINDTLDLVRMDAGHMLLRPAPFDPSSMLQAIGATLGTLAEKKGIRLSVEVEDLPPATLDEAKVRQIITNLVGNAIKFTSTGGTVRIVARVVGGGDHEEWLQMDVIDDGIGIPKEDQERIFHRFEQVDSSSTRKQDGTGIGLALVRNLVELHHGTIGVESTVGEGSRFTVSLPLHAIAAKDAAA